MIRLLSKFEFNFLFDKMSFPIDPIIKQKLIELQPNTDNYLELLKIVIEDIGTDEKMIGQILIDLHKTKNNMQIYICDLIEFDECDVINFYDLNGDIIPRNKILQFSSFPIIENHLLVRVGGGLLYYLNFYDDKFIHLFKKINFS